METKSQPSSNRRRYPWLAVALAVLIPAVAMLYVGRPLRAVVYLGLTLLAPLVAFYLAKSGLWPAGLSWVPFVLLVPVACMIDGYRIARAHETNFTGPWFTTWQGLTAVAAVFVVGTIAIRAFLLEPFRQPSGSMLPTLVEDDHFFLSKLAYRDALPQRGDVVVFRLPEAADVSYVKRVVGLPGDVVAYDQVGKRLTINGTQAPIEPLGDYADDPQYLLARENLDGVAHLVLHYRGRQSRGGVYEVPDGHYFVMGDNRDNSRDSRFEGVEFVPAEDILGRVTLVWWNTDDPKRAGTVVE